MNRITTVALVAPFALVATTPAMADTYTKANFSGGIFGNAGSVKPPLTGGFARGDTFTGSFVFDNNLIPSGPPTFQNVGFASFPDAANIPAGDAFTLNFGSYTFTLANDPAAQIQYNGNKFNGFAFNTVFDFEGSNYVFSANGGVFQVYAEGDPLLAPLISGYFNIGNAALSELTPYTPQVDVPGAVPEPATWAMMIAGFGAAGIALRRRRRIKTTVRFA